jgi:hypothetical protein
MLNDLIMIAGILVVALIGFNMTKSSFSVLEAMANQDKDKSNDGIVDVVTIAKNQTEMTSTAISNLNIKEHRAQYNTINDQMEQWVSAKMIDQVKVLSHKLNSKADMAEVSKIIGEINAMKTFKTALDDCSKFVDAH